MFKQKATLTVLYSLLIFVPLLLMQYLKTILQVARTDWWLDPTAVPSVYGPLSGIADDIQQTSMIQFRLYDTNKIVTAITDQIYGPSPIARLTLLDALKQYRDSLPGIILFLAIVAALVLTVFLVVKTLTGSSMEKVLPVLTATTTALLFFTCLGALQVPLAISGEVNAATAAAAVLTTVLLTLPAALVTYSPKKRATDDMLLAKAKELLARLQIFEQNLNAVKNGIPLDVTSVEGKMLIVKDKLNETYTKALARYYDSSESDRKYEELDKRVSVELESLFSELDVLLREYHTLVNCEYASWVGKLGSVGLKVEPAAKVEFEKELPIETRIERIKGMLDAGRALANENIPLVEEIYGVVRSLYDPNLPEQSRAVTFAKEKLAEKTAPWVPIEALFVAMNNWRRQYSDEIAKSVGYIRESLGYVAKLDGKSKTLLSAMETGNFDKVMSHVKSAQSIEFGIEENTLNVTEIAVIGNVFQRSLSIATQVLQLFYDELRNKEAVIQNLLPKKDYLWEKNITLDERMNLAVETVSNPQKFGLKQTLESLPKFLSSLDEVVATLAAYSERKELLLNYPTAAIAIENQLGEKDRVFARDLPFEAKHSEEFLKLFYSHRYPEFSFDEENVILAKKP